MGRIHTVKKIRVSGCCNCPFREINAIDSTKSDCNHPSFWGAGPSVSAYQDFDGFRDNVPSWCPLDDEHTFYGPIPCGC